MITVKVDSATFRQAMDALARQIGRPRPVLQAAARDISRTLQRHFRDRNRTPNRLGGTRTHWWAGVARATAVASVTDQQAVVSISEPGIGLHYLGGVVQAKEARYLTIPIHPMAHGKRARQVELETGLRIWVQRLSGGGRNLVQTLPDGSLRALYALKESVRIPRDPDALPSQAALEQSALRAAQAVVSAIVRRTSGGS